MLFPDGEYLRTAELFTNDPCVDNTVRASDSIGEHASVIRARVCDRLAFLGIELDAARNEEPELDADIGAGGASVRSYVVRSREDLQIAHGVRAALL